MHGVSLELYVLWLVQTYQSKPTVEPRPNSGSIFAFELEIVR